MLETVNVVMKLIQAIFIFCVIAAFMAAPFVIISSLFKKEEEVQEVVREQEALHSNEEEIINRATEYRNDFSI